MWGQTRSRDATDGRIAAPGDADPAPVRFGLTLKFVVAIGGLLTIAVVSLGWIFLVQVEESALRELREKGLILAKGVADRAAPGVFTDNRADLEAILATLQEHPDVRYAGVADERGAILAEYRSAEGEVVPDWAAAIAAVAASEPLTVAGARSNAGAPVYFLRAPVILAPLAPIGGAAPVPSPERAADDSANRIGGVCVGVSAAAVRRDIDALRGGLAIAALAVLAAGLGLAVVLVRLIVEPIRQLVRATDRIASGEFGQPIPRQGEDEIGLLADSFNRMTHHLRQSREALERSHGDLERKVQERTRALQETRDRLVQAEKMTVIGQLVSGVAHELNNPLAGVLGFAQLLQRQGPPASMVRGLGKIEAEAERCRRVVQNLLIFARKNKPQKSAVDLNAVVERALEMREYHLRTDGIVLVRDLDPVLPHVLLDENQIQQVLLNLINNAHHALIETQGPRSLRVSTRSAADRIVLQVEDTGTGIAPENLMKIFDPFFTTKEVGRGTGLGLSICYGIVQEHHGDIQVKSVPGRGTTFTIELPVAAEAAAPAPDPGPESGTATPRAGRILLVDDEATILEVIGDALRLDGHEVVAESNGAAALARLGHERFDLVLSDLKMPLMSGQEMFERLTQAEPRLRQRVIFTTGDTASPETHAFLEATGNPWLQKPFDLNEVRGLVRRLLRAA
jgi:signal transduction histidine kinase